MSNVADNSASGDSDFDHHTSHGDWDTPRPHHGLRSRYPSSRKSQTPTLRERLITAMGLAFDPFSSGVSEKDLAPDFGAIYVDLQPSLLKDLQRPAASLVFADYGMGKTATRLALEYTLRLARTPLTLCVTYTPDVNRVVALTGEQLRNPSAATEEQVLRKHLRDIAREMSTDLLVQYIERLPERPDTSELYQSFIQQQALQRQAQSVSPTVSRGIRIALRDNLTDGVIWRGIRPVVRHVAVTDAWRALLAKLAAATRAPDALPASWEETLYDVRALSFEQTFVLVDAVDDGTFDAHTYFQLIRPLIAAIGDLQKQHVYLKCFLPLAVKDYVLNAEELHIHALTPPPEIATITEISATNLQKIITDRFEAASMSTASFRSLDWLGPEIEESIQAHLATLAQGSPRRLIELVSALLDFHSTHGFREDERLWLTPAEWKSFLDEVERQHSVCP